MRLFPISICLLIACASHAELTIFEVQRNLPLANDEKVFHDYYVDSGSETGLKTGMTVMVKRKQPLFDYYRNREVADFQLNVAKVKVIQVQENLSVVRLVEDIARESAPISDEPFIMIGDRLDLGQLVAEVEPPVPAVVSAPVPAPVAPVAPTPRIVVNSVELTIDDPKAGATKAAEIKAIEAPPVVDAKPAAEPPPAAK